MPLKYIGAKCVKKSVKLTVWPFVLYFFPGAAVRIFYRMIFGHFPDLKNPRSINEKLQLLKVGSYYNDPLVTDCIDKLRVKDLLENRFCAGKLGLSWAKLYAEFDTVDEFFAAGLQDYPQKFVIKCNHGSGHNYICTDKSKINEQELRQILTAFLKDDYWKHHAEYQYRFIKKKIFVEEFLEDIGDTYKIYCFNGKPRFFYISNPDEKGNPDVYLDFFDMDFTHLPISLAHHRHCGSKIEKPATFEQMVKIAEELSKEFPFVRVDMFSNGRNICFSELTFLPTGGYMELAPEGTDIEWGNLLQLKDN